MKFPKLPGSMRLGRPFAIIYGGTEPNPRNPTEMLHRIVLGFKTGGTQTYTYFLIDDSMLSDWPKLATGATTEILRESERGGFFSPTAGAQDILPPGPDVYMKAIEMIREEKQPRLDKSKANGEIKRRLPPKVD